MIKVIVERRLRAGKEADLAALLEGLWVKAMHAPGYITGETLRSVEEPAVWLTISSWSDINTWRSWAGSRDRREFLKQIEPLLRAPARESAFEYAFREV